MTREYTPTTPEDVINAWCGTQTSSLGDSPSGAYVPLAEELLLCSLGATPRANDTSANCKAHAGAARWLRGDRRGGVCFEEETPEPCGIVLARSSSMTV
jgi:hypothetical protein